MKYIKKELDKEKLTEKLKAGPKDRLKFTFSDLLKNKSTTDGGSTNENL
jgi:hypothetical protein